jgi:CheY-like chemotaxis protein
LGCGSQLLVELPLVPNALVPVGAHTPPAPQQIPKMTTRRVLVVDDNADAGELLAVALRMAGHQVEVLDDPYCVADATERFRPEAVVLDLGMPGLDGYAVAACIHERLGERAPPLIALTGYGQPDDRQRTHSAGFAAHYVKPVHVAQLVGTIADVCEARTQPERLALPCAHEPNPTLLVPSVRAYTLENRKGARE